MQCNLPLVFELVSKLQVPTFSVRISVEVLSSNLHITRLGGKYYMNQTKHTSRARGTITTS
jgi:hypothetical protein